jgi:hypothetical protein
MRPHAADRIVVESEKVAQPSRAGVIEEVLQEHPPRVRVRWEDGHTSILTRLLALRELLTRRPELRRSRRDAEGPPQAHRARRAHTGPSFPRPAPQGNRDIGTA